MQKVSIKILSNQMSHLEQTLLEIARADIQKGHDLLYLDLKLQSELDTWKRERIKYRNAPTVLIRTGSTMFIRHQAADLVKFESLI
jgi:hypothetical protein